MSIQMLKDMLMSFIRKNLYLMSEICRKNCLNLPHSLAMEIIEQFCCDNYSYILSDNNRLSTDMLQLTVVSLKRNKDLREEKNFKFLRSHPVKHLTLKGYRSIDKLFLSPLLENFEMIACVLNLDDIKYLGMLLSNCHHLKSVNFGETVNNINSPNFYSTWQRGFEYICEGLKSSAKSLLEFKLPCLSHGRLSDLQSFYLGNLLKDCSSLRKIDFSFKSECENGLKNAFDGLKASAKHLLNIDFGFFSYRPVSVYLEDMLANCTSLKQIRFQTFKTEHAMEKPFKSLKFSSNSLLKVDLLHCLLSGKEAIAIGESLKECNCLEEILLDLNFNGSNSFKKITEGLKSSSKSLVKITILNCSIDGKKGGYLGDLFKECTSLQEIELNSINYCWTSFDKICDALESLSSNLLEDVIAKCQYSRRTIDLLTKTYQECEQSKSETKSAKKIRYGEILGKVLSQLEKVSSKSYRVYFYGCPLLGEENLVFLQYVMNDNEKMKSSRYGKGFEKLFNGLKHSSLKDSLLKINIKNFLLAEQDLVCFGDLLKECASLQDVRFSSKRFIERGIDNIFNGLATSYPSISKVYILNIDLTSGESQTITDLLNECNFSHAITLLKY